MEKRKRIVMKLIDKSEIVAEIEKLQKVYSTLSTHNNYEDGLKEGRLIGYKDALSKINSLEVKEIDLEKRKQIVMAQEEKARAYDETIKKLREFYRDYDTISCLIDVKEELANLFPELAESEDERIRKALIEYFTTSDNSYYAVCGVDTKKILAWLKK